MTVHRSCQTNYTRQASIEAAAKRASSGDSSSPNSSTDSSSSFQMSTRACPQDKFDFENRCIFCGDETNTKHNEISYVSKVDTRETILQCCNDRADELGNVVYNRISIVPD